MILHALNKYYDCLLEDENSGIARPGLSKAKVSHALVINSLGELVGIIDLRVEKGKKLVAREMDVPEQIKRSSGIAPNFMCDNCSYVLGLGQKVKESKEKRLRESYESYVKLHEEILGGMEDQRAQAVLSFLHKWDIVNGLNHPKIKEYQEALFEGSNLVFKMEGFEGFIHESNDILKGWESYNARNASDIRAQCLVTGELAPIARLHPNVKGVVGAQSSGASLVSFNLDSFTSYGKTQSFNAPVSDQVAFSYTTVLNHLLSKEKHRVRIGDTTMIFWAQKAGAGREEDLISALFYPVMEVTEREGDSSIQSIHDPHTVQLIQDIFTRIRNGQPVKEGLEGVDKEVDFYILGLAPNASRLSVRFWQVDQYQNFIEKVTQHYRDMALVKGYDRDPDFIPIGWILKELAPLGDAKRIPPLLGGILMRSILTGMPYSQSLYNALISRIRADQKVNYIRVAMIKACLVRKQRYLIKGTEVKVTMALNEESTDIAYRLGRLFALLEKAQEEANPGLNATIKDRYYGAASATPASVFPILMRLAQHHIAKAEYGRSTDKRIEEVLSGIDRFPAHLNLDEQGLFVLGYYHQRQARFTKSEKKEG